MVDEIILTLEQLRSLIGLRMYHQNVLCKVIEVLEDGPCIVLQSLETMQNIQPNLHGDATRRAPTTYTISVLNPEKTELHSDYLALNLADDED